MPTDLRSYHSKLLSKLQKDLIGNNRRISIKKKTISNLFRYETLNKSSSFQVDLSKFNKPLYIDLKKQILEVQGLTTYEDIVNYTLPFGFLPTVTPELKHITVAGAIVGIGIESNSYKYGFVHDSLIEAEVLLPDGKIIICTANNQYSDLFYGLPNSYATLGYILRLKIKLRKVKPYVELKIKKFTNEIYFLKNINSATKDSSINYIESLIYSKDRLYLITGKETYNSTNIISIYGKTIIYKNLSKEGKVMLSIKDYIFRYDPEWFWAIPESLFFKLFRFFAPSSLRNSSFYAHYAKFQNRILLKIPFIKHEDPNLELLIQDWQVSLEKGYDLLKFALENLDIVGKPFMGVLVKTKVNASFYPMKKNKLYFNLGSYSYVKKIPNKPSYTNTKMMDKFCFKLNGIKMLYSSTFISKNKFNAIYNGGKYNKIKNKYDPKLLLPSLFEKVVKGK